MKAFFACVLLSLVWLAGPALAWSDNDWSYRKEITLDTTPSGGSVGDELRNFPVLIRLDTSNFTFDDAKQDGSDIRFYAADDKTALPFKIESFDPKLGLAMIWVSVFDLPANGQVKLFMYFGNKKAGVAPVAGPLFDPIFHGVYHFQTGNLAGLDDSGYRNNLAGIHSVSGAWIGQGAEFTGSNPVALPVSLGIDPATGFTFEAWIKPHDASASGVIYANQSGASALVIGLEKGAAYVAITNNGAVTKTQPLPPLAGGWNHIAVTSNAQSTTLYINGLPATTLAIGTPPIAGSASLAGSPAGPGFAGELDEVRISQAVRSAAYIKASYATASEGSRLVHLGPTEQPATSGFGYFGIIFASVTPDAWAVIAVLMAMGVMSWIVMWSKGTNAGRTRRANKAFLIYYDSLKGDLLNLESEHKLSKRDLRELAHSSLYRLYQVGVAELSARREELGGKALSEENIEAIRASLDAALVEENQKLDSSMVLLTISIAGAPFIGLLGTVLGVMITFAAIAAAGDVNVNAIAPGIAAALLATVAGLAVAIPALFGYNYISSINSAIAGQTQIFGDRLITRFAEWQRHGSHFQAIG